MRRKHRVLVEITFETPVTGKLATNVVKDLIQQGDHVEQNCTHPDDIGHPKITKITAKDFVRVYASAQFRTSEK